ncbi:MAG TPA: ferredoxin [Clostridiales bacterium]|nr:ferredoxin [Clostridiales bacterium]
MPNITFLPDNITVNAQEGALLSEAAQAAGVSVSLPCAGHGMCGKCLVCVESGEVDFQNNGKLPGELTREGYVLACRSRVKGDACVRVANRLEEEKGSFSDTMNHVDIEGALFPKEEDLKPYCRKVSLRVPQAEMLDGLGDYDRFEKAVLAELGAERIVLPLFVLRTLPDVLREKEGGGVLWFYREGSTAHVVDFSAEERRDLGVCVDIGTTTVAVRVVDMEKNTTLGERTAYNAQIERGMDVISRISYAKNAERIAELRDRALQTVNDSIRALTEELGLLGRDIRNVSVAANTTMTQLFLGIVPEYIRLEPYTPAVFSVPVYSAGEVGLVVNPCAPVLIAPNVGSYVGGDITSGILCTDFAKDAEEISLFIDIGTNGEIVFGNNEFLLACACSAGPAFEGGGIECGMRASEGAIETVALDADTAVASYTVIGGNAVRAKGICGSGLISLAAQMLKIGVIDQRGKFDRSGRFSGIQVDGKKARYYIVPGEGMYPGVYITEMDIDNLIRAKAAIFSACRTLLKSVDMEFDCIDKLYIAGGFGRYIDVERAKEIGLLPNIPAERFAFIGNASLAGAHFALVSEKHRQTEYGLANRMTYIDLSTEPGYMDEYVSAMFLPHTDERLFQK